MPIRAACTECGHESKMPSNLAGKRVRCTACKAIFLVPAGVDNAGNAPARSSAVAAFRQDEKRKPNEQTARRRNNAEEREPSIPPVTPKGIPLWVILGECVMLLLLCVGGVIGALLLFNSNGKEEQIEVVQKPPEPELPTPLVEWPGKALQEAPAMGTKGLRIMVKGKLERIVTLTKPIREKSLEAWFTLVNLDQRNAALLRIDDGVETWDGIVYADTLARQWYPGSSYRHRSKDLGGQVETAGPTEMVHLLIVYSKDNLITLYRNGQSYGDPFLPQGPSSTLRTYPAEASRLHIGADAEGNLLLQGDVKEVRLYDRVLTQAEVTNRYNEGKARLLGKAPTP